MATARRSLNELLMVLWRCCLTSSIYLSVVYAPTNQQSVRRWPFNPPHNLCLIPQGPSTSLSCVRATRSRVFGWCVQNTRERVARTHNGGGSPILSIRLNRPCRMQQSNVQVIVQLERVAAIKVHNRKERNSTMQH